MIKDIDSIFFSFPKTLLSFVKNEPFCQNISSYQADFAQFEAGGARRLREVMGTLCSACRSPPSPSGYKYLFKKYIHSLLEVLLLYEP